MASRRAAEALEPPTSALPRSPPRRDVAARVGARVDPKIKVFVGPRRLRTPALRRNFALQRLTGGGVADAADLRARRARPQPPLHAVRAHKSPAHSSPPVHTAAAAMPNPIATCTTSGHVQARDLPRPRADHGVELHRPRAARLLQRDPLPLRDRRGSWPSLAARRPRTPKAPDAGERARDGQFKNLATGGMDARPRGGNIGRGTSRRTRTCRARSRWRTPARPTPAAPSSSSTWCTTRSSRLVQPRPVEAPRSSARRADAADLDLLVKHPGEDHRRPQHAHQDGVARSRGA